MIQRLRSAKFSSLTAALLVAAGLVLRLRAYLSGRSLWLDEAMLALNLIQRDVFGLMKPLDYEQGAPLGFLLLQKFFITLAGAGEPGLRLLPFLAGCALLILSALWLRRFLSTPGLLLALALLAFSPTLVYYSAENKQYMLDAALTLAVLLLAARPRRFLAIFGALALWFSHPLIFVLAAVGLAGLIFESARWRAWLLTGALWLTSFGLFYLVNLRGLTQNQFLLAYWREFFPPFPPSIFWLGERLNGLLGSFGAAGLGLQSPFWLSLLTLAAGLFWLARRHGQAAAQIGGVFVFALAAAALGKYPLGGRMALFLLPLLAVLLGAGLEAFWAAARRLAGKTPAGLAAAALGGFLLFAPAQLSLQRLITPFMRENLHPALTALRESRQPGDGIYIYPAASPAFLYYAPRYGFAPESFFASVYLQAQSNLPQILADLKAFSAAPRLWVLFAHVYEKDGLNEMQAALNFLEADWRCKTHTRAGGTGVTLTLCLRR
ncbi:MAG: hypothetical protein Fur0035_16910 [Anaerolineales bacterium]